MGIKRELSFMQESELDTHVSTELYHVINEHAPDAIKMGEIKNQFGRKVAIVSPQSYREDAQC